MGKTKKYTLLKAIFRYSLRNFVKLNNFPQGPVTPSQIFVKNTVFDNRLLIAVSKIVYLTYETFFLGLLRPFAVNFCLFTTETTHFRDFFNQI